MSALKLYFALKSDAQAKADATHQWLLTNDPSYAKSVSDGQTKRWSIPSQDVDMFGALIGTTDWFIVTKARCDGSLTTAEKAALLPGNVVKMAIAGL